MKDEQPSLNVRLLPIGVLAIAVALWYVCARFRFYELSVFPSPAQVLNGFREEITSNRLVDDLIASLFRVAIGFTIATALGVPLGLWLGLRTKPRTAFLPAINFFRNLSSLSWIPFAIFWFGVGDKPVIFLVFIATFFPIVLAVTAAVANIPAIHFRVAQDYGIQGWELLSRVTLPAITPQLITTLRMTMGMAWVVLVAAEMTAGQSGLGWAIWDARNGLRPDILVVEMIMLGTIGIVLDRLLLRLSQIPSVRWGYER